MVLEYSIKSERHRSTDIGKGASPRNTQPQGSQLAEIARHLPHSDENANKRRIAARMDHRIRDDAGREARMSNFDRLRAPGDDAGREAIMSTIDRLMARVEERMRDRQDAQQGSKRPGHFDARQEATTCVQSYPNQTIESLSFVKPRCEVPSPDEVYESIESNRLLPSDSSCKDEHDPLTLIAPADWEIGPADWEIGPVDWEIEPADWEIGSSVAEKSVFAKEDVGLDGSEGEIKWRYHPPREVMNPSGTLIQVGYITACPSSNSNQG